MGTDAVSPPRFGGRFRERVLLHCSFGGKDTDIRRRSNGVRDFIVKPAAEAHGLKTVRADDVGEPGQITAQAVQHCLRRRPWLRKTPTFRST